MSLEQGNYGVLRARKEKYQDPSHTEWQVMAFIYCA